MKKQPIIFLALFALALCSFALFENQEEAPIEEAIRQQYLAKFKKVELPYIISTTTNNISDSTRIHKEFAYFIPAVGRSAFSRIGPNYYYAEILVKSTDKYDAVIYTSSYSRRSELDYINCYLQTIDKKGNVIAIFHLGNLKNQLNNVCQINADFSILTAAQTPEEIQILKIADDGKIVSHKVNSQAKPKVKAG